MFIKEVRVEEGFLDGLELQFAKGLNVVIGARGTGKTSLIELLRYCLGSAAYTQDVQRLSTSQALAVLGTGIVSVSLDIGGQEIVVQRTATDRSPRLIKGEIPFLPPIVLSQSEIEKLAVDEGGRLRLIDDFRPQKREQEASVAATQRLIGSITVQIHDVAASAEALRDRLDEFSKTEDSLRQAELEQKAALKSLANLEPIRERLSILSKQQSDLAVGADTFAEVSESVGKWASTLARAARAVPSIPTWPSRLQSDDPLRGVRLAISTALDTIQEASKLVQRTLDEIEALSKRLDGRLADVAEEGRPLRRKLNEAVSGAGELNKLVAQLQQQIAQKRLAEERLQAISAQLERLHVERRHSLEQLESARENIYRERLFVSTKLNNALGPLVRVDIERAGLQTAYISILINALQGSGLHKTLAARIAERMSPRELAEAVERSDIAFLSNLAEIPEDRALRVIAQLSRQPLAELLVAWVDDGVTISLLDGSEPKVTGELSTGQRCTAILPILMQHNERVLIIDQPEDNLDNAFVVETLVKAIRERPRDAQMIVSTHNPNIPVLGDADKVILMESTGKRGFVRLAGELLESKVVDAITSVMEGGRQAFEQRASFYGRHT